MTSALVHVGFHKAGSTWLQRHVFAAPPFALPIGRRTLANALVHPAPFRFDPAATKAAIAEACAPVRAAGRLPVLSHERLSGNPHAGGYDAGTIAERISAAVPDAHVLVVIRDQRTMLLSTYKQYVAVGGTASLEHYVKPRVPVRRVPLFDLRHLEYDGFIGRYHELFGADRVTVLAYEALAASPGAFVQSICDAVGVTAPDHIEAGAANVGLSGIATQLKRPANFLFVRDAVHPSPLVPVRGANTALRRILRRVDQTVPRPVRRRVDAALARRVEALVGDRFSDSNAATARLTGLDLSALGYP